MYQLHWDEKLVGISLGVVGILVGAVQGGLIRWTSPRLGNEKSIYLGMALYAIGMFLFAFATQTWMMFAFLVPYCLGGLHILLCRRWFPKMCRRLNRAKYKGL
jgi:DHA1 family tetracycline resistance protein-like MFS transporter